jgi:formylglycine-generating enzyme required for sulfatase activity
VLGRAPGAPDDCPAESPPFSCDADEQPINARVRAFWLDRFEITVGRFRKFVDAAIAGYRPAAGSGKHGYLNRGTEAGWNASWPLPASESAWQTALRTGTWTALPGLNETKPITMIDWYMAQAFCIFDGGFLPTEAEWEFAASGGEERIFPWSSPPNSTLFDAAHSALACCTVPSDVGLKPPGDARWGHADLAGNALEWTLDDYQSAFPIDPCEDCTVDLSRIFRTVRGGDYDSGMHPRAAARESGQNNLRDPYASARCARRAAVADGG